MNRYVSIAAGLLVIISVFLPFITMPFLGSLSVWSASKLPGAGGQAYVFIGIGVLIAGVGFADRRWLNIVNILLFLLLLFKIGGLSGGGSDAQIGIGLFTFLLAALLTLVGAIWGMVKKKKTAPAATPTV
jgi:hypothetical protein